MLDSTETAPATLALDKIALAALRLADSISFHHRHHDGHGRANCTSYILASKRNEPDERNPFAPRETNIVVPCEVEIRDYERQVDGFTMAHVPEAEMKHYTCFEMEHSPQYSESTWYTLARLMKVGDILRLEWTRGAFNSPRNNDRGVTGDELHMMIIRGKTRMRFMLDAKAFPADSNDPFRPVRRNTYSIA